MTLFLCVCFSWPLQWDGEVAKRILLTYTENVSLIGWSPLLLPLFLQLFYLTILLLKCIFLYFVFFGSKKRKIAQFEHEFSDKFNINVRETMFASSAALNNPFVMRTERHAIFIVPICNGSLVELHLVQQTNTLW